MQMRQRDVAVPEMQNTEGVGLMLKLKMMFWCDDVAAGRRRLHISSLPPREATTASGGDNAASPRLADTAERDYFTSERG